jgi:hypothetical protein
MTIIGPLSHRPVYQPAKAYQNNKRQILPNGIPDFILLVMGNTVLSEQCYRIHQEYQKKEKLFHTLGVAQK